MLDDSSSNVSCSSSDLLESSWFSQLSDTALTQSTFSATIPVIISETREQFSSAERLPHVRKTLKRENKCIQALSLPKFTVYNMRSFWDKLNCFATDMHERIADLSFLSEVWQKSESKKHQAKIEELMEMQNILYLSTPRPGNRRGGGAALAINPKTFSVTKLNIAIPPPLEIVWALLRPIEASGAIRKVILCSLYSPPNSRRNNMLVDHISITYNSLKITHPEAGIIICGDKNSLDEKKILSLDPNFRQILSQNTRQDKRLYLVITDLHSFYHSPEVIPPVPVDVIGKGVPSDHRGVLVTPLSSANSQRKPDTEFKKVRPLPESSMLKFGSFIVQEEWSFLTSKMSSTELVETFEKYTSQLVEQYFPEKEIKISSFDKPFYTEELRMLRRQRQRAYTKGGKSQKYIKLKQEYDEKLRIAAKKYHSKIISEVSDGKRTNAYSALRKLEPGENKKKNSFTLPDHADKDYTPAQSAEKLAEYFSEISQQFDPINSELFPPWIRQKLEKGKDNFSKPVLEEWQVHKKFQKAQLLNPWGPTSESSEGFHT